MRSLLELAFAADSPAAARLIPGHCEVDEPLEEVTLGRFRGPPGELQLLVRVEVPPGADQLEPALEVRLQRHRRDASTGAADALLSGPMATILLCGVDLYFRGKLEASLPQHHFIAVDGIDPPDLVVSDISRVDPDEVADMYPEVPILGFTNHTDTAGLRAAHTAGFDQVVAKSALVERARELIDGLLASVE